MKKSTHIYKSIGELTIKIEVYVSEVSQETPEGRPTVLFIHGGGWTTGDCEEIGEDLIQEFLDHNFVVTSANYRLLPEASLKNQCEDLWSMECWLRGSLPSILKTERFSGKIVVVGASAGAHLALLTPKLWRRQPSAILSMYGPTDMHNLPSLNADRPSELPLVTPELLAAAISDTPLAEFSPSKTVEHMKRPRVVMIINVFDNSCLTEYLIKGLERDEVEWKLPERGSVNKDEINEISPLWLSQHIRYPPVYQLIGSDDKIFDVSHVHEFHEALVKHGIKCGKMILPGKGHAFDTKEEAKGETNKKCFGPAVKWIVENME